MQRRRLLKTVGATGLLGIAAGSAAATESQGCSFVCCEDCRVAYCPGGCDCQRNCGRTIVDE